MNNSSFSYFSERFIQRPVLAWVLNIVVIILGMLAFSKLPVRQYPQVEFPVVTVMTQFDGAGPDLIESQITRPLEESLAGLEGLDSMTSSSEVGQSKIKLHFKPSRSIDAAAADIRDRLARDDKLPQEATRPRVTKADVDSDAVVSLSLYGKDHSVPKLYDYATRYVQNEFEAIQGVASLDLYGGASYEMHIVLDPVRLASYNLTASDVSEALRQQNINKPAGSIGGDERSFLVSTKAQLMKPDDFNKIVLAERSGYVVRLADVGRAELSSDDKKFRVRYNGQDAIMLGIVAQSRSNPIDISKAVQEKLAHVRESLPRGMFLEVANDRSIFIEKSIDQVYRSIWEAIALVIFVVFFFLRSFKASLIPLITIPISLLGAFFVIYTLDFTINTLTLLAIVLAIGLVVDDAIVVLENIYRHIEEGLSPLKASFKGIREIQFSIIAMTLTLAAVYTPIALASGVTGKLFTEFALTLVGAVLWSGFVALVLSPMMCSRLLRHVPPEDIHPKTSIGRSIHGMNLWIGRFLDRLDTSYASLLEKLFQAKRWVLLGATLFGLSGYGVSLLLPAELAPREDQGLIRVTAQPPTGATLNYLDKYATEMDDIVGSLPEVQSRLLLIQAGDDTFTKATLTPWGTRPACATLVPQIQTKLDDILGFRAIAYCPSRSLMGGASERPLEFVIQTSRSFKELVGVARRVRSLMAKNSGVNRVTMDWDLAADTKEYLVNVKRDVAASSGVSIQNLATTLDLLVSGRKATSFERESKLYPVKIWMGDMNKRSPQDLKALMVRGSRNNKEFMVPLQDLVDIEEKTSNPSLSHTGGMRSVTIYAGLNSGVGLGNVYKDLKKDILELLPAGFRVTEGGELKRFLTEQSTILLIFGLALAFIFLVLAGQFESFRDPFIIILSVPLALAGAVFTLKIIPQGTLNIYSQIGCVTLIGLITKHGILIVDFANALRDKGAAIEAAVLEACRLRLRPILMTTLAMALGAIPLAMASGPGFEARRQIGWVIVGGMSLGTLFTLFVIPVVYLVISKKHRAPLKEAFPEDH